jgi:hypothetical protein
VSVDIESVVGSWVEHSRVELVENGFVQIDIDDLVDPPPERAVAVGLDCLRLAVRFARGVADSTSGLLTIPLPFREQDLPPSEYPSVAELLGGAWTYGPGLEVPALYLLSPNIWRLHEAVEEYRITLAEVEPFGSDLIAYYRAWRALTQTQQFPQEWSRAIYVRTT